MRTPEEDMQLDWLRYKLSEREGKPPLDRPSFEEGWKAAHRAFVKERAKLITMHEEKYDHDTAVLTGRIEVLEMYDTMRVGEGNARTARRDALVVDIEVWWKEYNRHGNNAEVLPKILDEYWALVRSGQVEEGEEEDA